MHLAPTLTILLPKNILSRHHRHRVLASLLDTIETKKCFSIFVFSWFCFFLLMILHDQQGVDTMGNLNDILI